MRRWRLGLCFLLGLGLLLGPPTSQADDDIRAKIEAAGDAEKWDADLVIVLDDEGRDRPAEWARRGDRAQGR